MDLLGIASLAGVAASSYCGWRAGFHRGRGEHERARVWFGCMLGGIAGGILAAIICFLT